MYSINNIIFIIKYFICEKMFSSEICKIIYAFKRNPQETKEKFIYHSVIKMKCKFLINFKYDIGKCLICAKNA